MKKILYILLLLFSPLLGFNQNFGGGVSALYNIQSESFGGGARFSIFPDKTVSFVPQFSYFFVGPVSEWTVGLGAEFKVMRNKYNDIYLLTHSGYNNWGNPENSALEGAKTANVNFEVGAGIVGINCLRPFLEYRYNARFQESHVQLGLLYIFGCKKNTAGYRNLNRMRSRVKCSIYE